MRTNIDLNEELVREAMQYSTARTKRALVEEALQIYVAVKGVEERRRSYGQKLEQIRARTGSLRLRKSPAEVLREDRNRR